jgi:hypothetical protein
MQLLITNFIREVLNKNKNLCIEDYIKKRGAAYRVPLH